MTKRSYLHFLVAPCCEGGTYLTEHRDYWMFIKSKDRDGPLRLMVYFVR